MKTAHSQ